MAAVFPGAVRLYGVKADLVDTVLAEHVNLLQDEVTAVETTLGTGMLSSSWAGVYATPSTHATVAARLTNIEAGITSLFSTKADTSATVSASGVATLTNKTMSGASNTFSAIPQSAITSLVSDLALKAPLASPALTGSPTAPTQTAGDNSTKVATTAYSDGALATHTGSTAAHGATGAVVGTTNTQTLANKTLSSPVISTIINTGTLTLPTSTDTLVGRATTDTLTNKTLSGGTWNNPTLTGTITGLPSPNVVFLAKSASWTIADLTAQNTMILMSQSANADVALPSNTTAAYDIGASIGITVLGTSGVVAFTAGSGATVNGTPGLKLRTRYSQAVATKIATNEWVVSGDVIA